MTEVEDLQTLWTDSYAPLRNDFHKTVVEEMFGKARIESLTEECLTLHVENIAARNFIRKYAEPVILQNIINQSGVVPAQINYVFNQAKKREHTPVVEEKLAPQIFESQKGSGDLTPNPQIVANLNPKYTFDTFIIGSKNRLAFAAAQVVAENPGVTYNPLYIYGGVGLGKTHLMQAIGNAIIAADPSKKAYYTSGESFTNEFVDYLRRNKPAEFKQKYRNIDVFLVDDIQFIAGKDGIQEEFFHTFNALYQGQKQIVMTSDKVPSDIKNLEERLSSRFSSGMITDIQLPDQPTRQAILEAKCQERKYNIPESALSFIASHIETNIRELEGALNTVIAYLQSNGLEPTTEHVRAALRKFSTKDVSAKKGKSDLLIELVAGHFSISIEDLVGPCRQKELVHPRQILMYLLKHEAGMTLPMIGREIGGRDHTTVMYGINKITNDIKRNPSVLQDLQELKELFYDYR